MTRDDTQADNPYPPPRDLTGFVEEAITRYGEPACRSRSQAALQAIKILLRELDPTHRQELASHMKDLRADQEELSHEDLSAIQVGLAELDRGESVADADVWSRLGL